MSRSNYIKVGTVYGRHSMPVDTYLVDKVENPTDVFEIQRKVDASFSKIVKENTTHCFLYITGLTTVTLAAINWCMRNNIKVTAMHYDTKTGFYFSQRVL